MGAFHHAHWDAAHAYCTFNGLILAAMTLRDQAPDLRVLILDLDQHFGDGTQWLINRHGLDWIEHYSYGRSAARNPAEGHEWLTNFSFDLGHLLGARPDIVFYLAHMDSHKDDPQGGGLTSEQLLMRDCLVLGPAPKPGFLWRGRQVAVTSLLM